MGEILIKLRCTKQQQDRNREALEYVGLSYGKRPPTGLVRVQCIPEFAVTNRDLSAMAVGLTPTGNKSLKGRRAAASQKPGCRLRRPGERKYRFR